MDKKYAVITLAERPDLESKLNKLHSIGWVKYMREDPVAVRYWSKLFSWFPEYQFILLNEESKPIACKRGISAIGDR